MIKYYLLSLIVNDESYLLGKGVSIMVWDSFEGLSQSLIRTGGVFKELKPFPVLITDGIFPSIKEQNFNPVLLHLCNKEAISEIGFKKFSDELTLIKVDADILQDYKMVAY